MMPDLVFSSAAAARTITRSANGFMLSAILGVFGLS
jgi:hypothetical protein